MSTGRRLRFPKIKANLVNQTESRSSDPDRSLGSQHGRHVGRRNLLFADRERLNLHRVISRLRIWPGVRSSLLAVVVTCNELSCCRDPELANTMSATLAAIYCWWQVIPTADNRGSIRRPTDPHNKYGYLASWWLMIAKHWFTYEFPIFATFFLNRSNLRIMRTLVIVSIAIFCLVFLCSGKNIAILVVLWLATLFLKMIGEENTLRKRLVNLPVLLS